MSSEELKADESSELCMPTKNYKGPNGNYYILSCAHVLAMDSKAKFLPIGTLTLQPGTYDDDTDADKVSELYNYIKITFRPKGKNYADAAIYLLTTSEYLPYEVLGSDNQDTYKLAELLRFRQATLLESLEEQPA